MAITPSSLALPSIMFRLSIAFTVLAAAACASAQLLGGTFLLKHNSTNKYLTEEDIGNPMTMLIKSNTRNQKWKVDLATPIVPTTFQSDVSSNYVAYTAIGDGEFVKTGVDRKKYTLVPKIPDSTIRLGEDRNLCLGVSTLYNPPLCRQEECEDGDISQLWKLENPN
ncbi:hypothetical protein RhiJN_05986 [Ceratobasidium sp. AG-Ba]|nr:hypothetical protein RhiJN_05986 [Ceratobasidium sp. AG-Ba]